MKESPGKASEGSKQISREITLLLPTIVDLRAKQFNFQYSIASIKQLKLGFSSLIQSVTKKHSTLLVLYTCAKQTTYPINFFPDKKYMNESNLHCKLMSGDREY